jgi:hypothetical protein
VLTELGEVDVITQHLDGAEAALSLTKRGPPLDLSMLGKTGRSGGRPSGRSDHGEISITLTTEPEEAVITAEAVLSHSTEPTVEVVLTQLSEISITVLSVSTVRPVRPGRDLDHSTEEVEEVDVITVES